MRSGRVSSGEPLTLLLIAVSILGGIALAIACSYRPIALWWVMVACSAINIVRFGVRYSHRARANHPDAPAARLRIVAVVTRALARWAATFTGARWGASKASLDRQHTRFLIWFLEHNLFWTMIGFGASLVLWHRFGPTTPALVAMAALMTCGIFAALGAAAGAMAPTLGLCWREPCQTPDLLSPRRAIHDIGCVVVLKNRRDYAARCDWAKGGRFHELFLTVDDLARAGVEPALEAVLASDDAMTLRALARKERVDRALALAPVFASGLLAALVVVPLLAGSEPLPSLWTIVSMNANSRARPFANGDDPSRQLPPGAAISSDERAASAKATARSRESSSEGGQARNEATDQSPSQSSPRADGDATSSSGHERPDITGQRGGENSITGDAVASGRNGGPRPEDTAGQGSGQSADGSGSGTGKSSGGSGGASSSRDGPSGGSGGRGGGPNGYGTSGVAPQRAESPNALPDAPVNPGKTIEVVMPAFAEARGDSLGDDSAGTKRKAKATDHARADPTRQKSGAAPNEPATREPVQRWPNWIFELVKR
jgi:hypothetical protein